MTSCCISQTNSISTSFRQFTGDTPPPPTPPTCANVDAINVRKQIERVIDKAISDFLFVCLTWTLQKRFRQCVVLMLPVTSSLFTVFAPDQSAELRATGSYPSPALQDLINIQLMPFFWRLKRCTSDRQQWINDVISALWNTVYLCWWALIVATWCIFYLC